MTDRPPIDIARPTVYTPYPNPHLAEFVEQHLREKPYDPLNDTYFREPFVEDVRAGKNTPIYNAHSYHTKVPPQGIEPFIEHYTEPGDLILDPFCGSGMTGIAALKLGRKCILIDLSPAATFITYNYCTPVDVKAFEREAQRVLDAVKDEMDWLYETHCRECGGPATIQYTIWSETFACIYCGEVFVLWDVAVTEEGKVLRKFPCPYCGIELTKRKAKRTGSVPVRVNYECHKGCRRNPRSSRLEDAVSDFDLKKLQEIEERGIPEELWYPTDSIMHKGERWGDTWRAGIHEGITHVHHFYTTRNLWALARLWEKVASLPRPLKQRLALVFTSMSVGLSSKLVRYNFRRRGNGIVSGTLYVPSFQAETNTANAFESKFSAILKLARAQLKYVGDDVIISAQSATALSTVPDASVDYVFTDPPFGANLMYSELNFLWEAWLGHFTDIAEEAIINEAQDKGLEEYRELMAQSCAEMCRVLKPGRWMTMVFHNSQKAVWDAIQEALNEAGFEIGSIHTFDKKQRSFKQLTSEGAVGYDVIVNCYKPKATLVNDFEGKTTEQAIIGFLSDHLRELPRTQDDERTDRKLHSRTIGFFMQKQVKIDVDFDTFRKLLAANFKEIDGYWYLWGQLPEPREGEQLVLGAMGSIKSEADAIRWLHLFLETPQSWKEIHPKFLIALGPNKLQKDPRQILEENFILDEETEEWRRPTAEEAEGLNRTVDARRYRAFRSWARRVLARQQPELPTDDVLAHGFEQYFYQERKYEDIIKLARKLPKKRLDRNKELRMTLRLAKERVRDAELLRRLEINQGKLT